MYLPVEELRDSMCKDSKAEVLPISSRITKRPRANEPGEAVGQRGGQRYCWVGLWKPQST
jgi:hypothetical protein